MNTETPEARQRARPTSRVNPETPMFKLLYEAYLAGWNKEVAGLWRHPSTLERSGEPHTLAQMWAKHKTGT